MPKTTPKFEKMPAFEKLGELVMDELERRLGDPEDAKGLPGTLLMRLAEQYIKYLEKQDAQEAAMQELLAVTVTPLQMIDQEGLSDERKLEILYAYLKQIEEEWVAASARLVELRGDNGAQPEADTDDAADSDGARVAQA